MLTLQGVLAGMYPDLKVCSHTASVGEVWGKVRSWSSETFAMLVPPVQLESLGGCACLVKSAICCQFLFADILPVAKAFITRP